MLQEGGPGGAAGRQGSTAMWPGPQPAVPYCSRPAEEDLVLPTRCNTAPSREQDANKRRRRREGERKETRLWGLFHQTVSFLQPDTDTLCVLSRGNKIAGSCSRRVRRDGGRSWKNWRRAILNFMTLGS